MPKSTRFIEWTTRLHKLYKAYYDALYELASHDFPKSLARHTSQGRKPKFRQRASNKPKTASRRLVLALIKSSASFDIRTGKPVSEKSICDTRRRFSTLNARRAAPELAHDSIVAELTFRSPSGVAVLRQYSSDASSRLTRVGIEHVAQSSRWSTDPLSRHSITHIELIQQFLTQNVIVEDVDRDVRIVRID